MHWPEHGGPHGRWLDLPQAREWRPAAALDDLRAGRRGRPGGAPQPGGHAVARAHGRALHLHGGARHHGPLPHGPPGGPEPGRGHRLRRRAHDRGRQLRAPRPDRRHPHLPHLHGHPAAARRRHAPRGGADGRDLRLRGLCLGRAHRALRPAVVPQRPLHEHGGALPQGRAALLPGPAPGGLAGLAPALAAVRHHALRHLGLRLRGPHDGHRHRHGAEHQPLPGAEQQVLAGHQRRPGQPRREPHAAAVLGAAGAAERGQPHPAALPAGAPLLRLRAQARGRHLRRGQQRARALLRPELRARAAGGPLGRAAPQGPRGQGPAPGLQDPLLPHERRGLPGPRGRGRGHGARRGAGEVHAGPEVAHEPLAREDRRGQEQLLTPGAADQQPGGGGAGRLHARDGRPGLLRRPPHRRVLLRAGGARGERALHARLPGGLHQRGSPRRVGL
mmetsp:Transcript_13846/g.43346  ORF Transcript_13846/g.43346 Transcript_13846/m.43346 type:complete len:446 (-) Transcript_13846:603-1940(-)